MLTALAMGLGIVAAVPSLTIDADPPLNRYDILTTPFTVANDGTPFAVRSVRFTCQVDSVATDLGQFIFNRRLGTQVLATKLAHGGVVTGLCAVPGWTGNFIGTAGRQQLARVSIEVQYSIWGLPISRTVMAGFRTHPTNDGLRWIRVQPIPIWQPDWGN